MDNLNLISTFAEFKELKNIDKSTMIGVLEDVFRHLLIKTYETDENFDVIINPEKGDLEIWRNRTIVEDGEVENPNQQISLTDARKIDPTYEVGEEVADEIKLADFGRRSVLSLRQNPLRASWSWRRPTCTKSTRTRWAKLSPARFIRCGKKRC